MIASIRPVIIDDAKQLQDLFIQLESETDFMAIGQTDIADLAAYLPYFQHSHNQCFFVLECDSDEPRILGFALALPQYISDDKQSLAVIMGLCQSHTGQGFGCELLNQLTQWAMSVQISKLELTVKRNNKVAIHFYDRHGFKEKQPDLHSGVAFDGLNELYMVKDLG